MDSSGGFPAADAEKEMNPGMNKDFQVDPISSEVATAKEIKEQSEARKVKEQAKKAKEQEKNEAFQSFKTAIIVSGIIVAVAGAVFAITKKLREK